MKSGDEADVLFMQAGQKFAAALEIRPDYRQALNNWGVALSIQARMKSGKEADALFAQAREKRVAAQAIKRDKH